MFSDTYFGHLFCGGAGDDMLEGGSDNETLNGGSGNDILKGGSGNDTLDGGSGNDTLNGGTGTNALSGGSGDDTYVVDTGGNTITEGLDAGYDGVRSSISITLNDNIERLDLMGIAAINGTGNAADNLLSGNEAANRLSGLAGNDTYQFSGAWGQDSLIENDATVGNSDEAAFGTGILETDLMFQQSGNNLLIDRYGSTDSITVQDWYSGTANQIETFRASDGSVLLNTQVDQLIQAMASFSATNGGISWEQALTDRPDEVATVLAAHWS